MEKYNEKINRHTDWGGDASTGGLKVAGRRVQEFIKEELNSKVGAIYKEEGGTRVYCFANDEEKDKYLLSGDTSAILTSFETISKYKVLINQETLQRSHSVIYGTTGNTVEFQFKIIDESEMITDSRASIEYSFLANGIVTGYTVETQVNAEGWTTVTSEVIDKYLRKGENTITITITGLSTRASSQFIMTYNLFDLYFTTLFDYNVVQGDNNRRVISIPYIIECSDTKYLQFYIDGVSVNSNESMVINDVRKEGTATINIESLAPGTHTLQVGAYVKANDGTEFHTPYHYYTFAKIGSDTPSFLMSIELNKKQSLVLDDSDLVLKLDQFELLTFDWSLYDALTRRLTVMAEYDGSVVARNVFDTNGKISTLTFRPMNYGEGKLFKIYAFDEDGETKVFEHTIVLDVLEASSGIKETTDGMLLKMEANGRRNSDEGRDDWRCIGSDGVEYYATFNDFAWNAQQGWNEEDEALIISNGATVEFNLKPMINGWETYGGTLEIDLETFDIDDDDAVICECKDNIDSAETAYFRITATNAEFSTKNGIKINTRYKDNEKLKIAFIGNKIGNHEDGNLIYIMVNGVLERAAMYEDYDRIVSNATLKIGNPEGKCKVKLRSIRVYGRAISIDEEFNNFVVDSNNVQEMYEKNNILKPGTTEVGFDEIANKLPVMIFTGDMDALVKSVATKDWKPFDVEFINRQHPEFNFVSFNCQMKLQGTSSLGYPRKNFKLKTKDSNFDAAKYASLNYEIDETSTVGNKMLRNKTTGELVDFGEVREICITLGADPEDTTKYIPLKKGKYSFKKNSHKATKWTLKADFMESSCSHNVAAGRSWNDIFENTKFDLGIDNQYGNHTYKDSALVNSAEYLNYTKGDIQYRINNNTQEIKSQKDYVCRTEAQKICKAENADDIRTAVDGFPMVCFYRTSHQANDLVFIGQYNFINDKSSYEVFGFEDIDDPTDTSDGEKRKIYDASQVECWEGLKNANPISLFQTIKDWTDADMGWPSTYESRYPDPDDYGKSGKRWYDASIGSPLYELSKWLVSTRYSGNTIYDLEGNVKTTSDTINIDATFAKRINSYQYGYSEDTKDSYEYVEGTVPDTAENRQKKFETEKWEHFDVWKLAGYYIYLMRYGAVDQFVKNTMLFTDGNGKYDPRTDNKYRKWFFINYDNDCLFGLRNNGELAFHWNLDRQTRDGAADIIHDEGDEYQEEDVNTYAMMGHDSTLWNNLEADDEFMRMVRDLDNSMSNYGLNYNNMVTEFDTNQTEQWCERIYNANEKYKYIQAAKGIGDMSGNPVDNLWMLQGTRRSHRHWWIANHFNLLNAKWLSGDYKNTTVEIKTDALAGKTIRATAGTDYYFAWGAKRIYESNIEKKEGEVVNFVFPTDQKQGDPVNIYAINKFSEMDFSDIASSIRSGSFGFHISDKNVSNLLKKLVIGNPSVINPDGISTTSWECLKNLEYLDITNYSGIKIIPLSSFPNLHVLKAKGSGISSFVPANGSRYNLVELPTNISTLSLVDIKFNNLRNDLVYTPNINLESLTLANNSNIDISYFTKLVEPWIRQIESSNQSVELYRRASIDISNIKWDFSNLDAVRLFKNFSRYAEHGNFSLKGVINLTACGNLSQDNINEIKSIFGENCFNEKMSALYVKTPDSIFILPESNDHSMVAGQSYTFSKEIYPDEGAVMEELQNLSYGLVRLLGDEEDRDGALYDPITGKYYREIPNTESIRSGLVMVNNSDYTGTLRSVENVQGQDNDVIVMVKMLTQSSSIEKFSCVDFKIKDPTYAVTGTFVGDKNIYKGNEVTYSIEGKTADNKTPIGTHTVEWELTGQGLEYISSTGVVNNNLVIQVKSNEEPERYASINIKATYTNNDSSHTSFVVTQTALVLNSEVVITNETNPIVMNICHSNGWCSDSQVMLRDEAAAVTNIGTEFANVNSDFSFLEFSYFTSVASLSDGAFANSNLTEICLPASLRTLGNGCFKNCSKLDGVFVKNGDVYINSIPDNITSIPVSCFEGCTSLSKLKLPNSVNEINDFAFGGVDIKHILLHTEALDANTLILPDTENMTELVIGGLAFELDNDVWSSTNINGVYNSANKLETISIPKNIRIRSNQIFWSEKLSTIIVHPECTKMVSIDNVLYTYNMETLLRYAPMKETTSVYEVPSDVTSVYERAFYAVQNLNEVVFGGGINAAGLSRAMFENSNVKIVDLTNCINLTTINEYMFSNCTKLERVLFPNMRLDSILRYAFNGCDSMVKLEFPDTVTTVENYTIYNCDNLEHIKFSKICKMQDSDMNNIMAADVCPSLSSITLPLFSYEINGNYTVLDSEGNTVGTYDSKYEASKNLPLSGTIVTELEGESVVVNEEFNILFVGASTNLKYYYMNEQDDRKLFQEINGVIYSQNETILKKVPFKLESYTMPNTVIEIDNNAFSNNTIEELILSENITSIHHMSSLNIETLHIPAKVRTISGDALRNCGRLKTVYIDGYIETVGRQAFQYCDSLEEIYFYGGLGSIESFAFISNSRASKLHKIVILSDAAPSIGVSTSNTNELRGRYEVYTNNGETLSYVEESYNDAANRCVKPGGYKVVKNNDGTYTRTIPGEGSEIFVNRNDAENGMFKDGYSITIVKEGARVAAYHPFGYYNYNLVGLNYSGEKSLYVSYGATGYDSELWINPLLNDDVCNFELLPYKVNNESFIVKVYKDGVEYTEGTLYAISESGEYRYNVANTIASSTYNALKGGFEFTIDDNLYDNELITFYSDSNCQPEHEIGSIRIKENKSSYQIGEMTMSAGRSRGLVLGEPKPEMANITQTEYEMLVSKVNNLLEIINKMK